MIYMLSLSVYTPILKMEQVFLDLLQVPVILSFFKIKPCRKNTLKTGLQSLTQRTEKP